MKLLIPSIVCVVFVSCIVSLPTASAADCMDRPGVTVTCAEHKEHGHCTDEYWLLSLDMARECPVTCDICPVADCKDYPETLPGLPFTCSQVAKYCNTPHEVSPILNIYCPETCGLECKDCYENYYQTGEFLERLPDTDGVAECKLKCQEHPRCLYWNVNLMNGCSLWDHRDDQKMIEDVNSVGGQKFCSAPGCKDHPTTLPIPGYSATCSQVASYCNSGGRWLKFMSKYCPETCGFECTDTLGLNAICKKLGSACKGYHLECRDTGTPEHNPVKRCMCAVGYKEYNGKCIAESTLELNDICETLDNTCKDEHVVCRKTGKPVNNPVNRCWCAVGYAEDEGKKCIALTKLGLGRDCKKHNIGKPCKADNSECIGDKNDDKAKCACKSGYKRGGTNNDECQEE